VNGRRESSEFGAGDVIYVVNIQINVEGLVWLLLFYIHAIFQPEIIVLKQEGRK